MVREACFREPGDRPVIALPGSIKAVCVMLIAGVLVLGVAPQFLLETISSSYAGIDQLRPTVTASTITVNPNPH
jgi:hypothetical protein